MIRTTPKTQQELCPSENTGFTSVYLRPQTITSPHPQNPKGRTAKLAAPPNREAAVTGGSAARSKPAVKPSVVLQEHSQQRRKVTNYRHRIEPL